MANDALIQKLCKCSIIDCNDIGAITFATAINKFEKPAISDLIRFKTTQQEAQASEIYETIDSHGNVVLGELQKRAQIRRSEAVESHLSWLRNKEVKPWNERINWAPSRSISNLRIEDIIWGLATSKPNLPTHERPPELVFYDEMHSRAFEQALEIQRQQGSSSLSYTELDVRGSDAHGNRLRVQRACELKLEIVQDLSEQGNIEKTTMELKQILKLSTLDESSISPTKPDEDNLYQNIVKQLAQHEFDKALDERNHYLREVFSQEVDHVRTARQSSIAAHEWSFQKPEVCVRGPDGTMMMLTETRADFANGDGVVVKHTIAIEQSKGEAGEDYLFDLPTQGGESERQIRQARWTISSAIDKCIASGANDVFALPARVHGLCLDEAMRSEGA